LCLCLLICAAFSDYGFGTPDFKRNVITDCFGESRIDEYKDSPNFQIVLMCCVKTAMLSDVPGGRANALMVSRSMIENMKAAEVDGFHYLGQSVIKRCFLLEDADFFHAVSGAGAPSANQMAGRTSAATVMVDTSNWKEWSAEQVAGWMRTVPAISNQADLFLGEGITGKDLPEVDESFLSDCGISSKLMKKKVLGAIGELPSTSTSKVELFPASKVLV
jgi:hypothetical protein